MQENPSFQVVAQIDGNDIIVPLPPKIVEALQIHEDQKFELILEGDQLRLTPQKFA